MSEIQFILRQQFSCEEEKQRKEIFSAILTEYLNRADDNLCSHDFILSSYPNFPSS